MIAKNLEIGQSFMLRGNIYRRYKANNFKTCLTHAENPWEEYVLGVRVCDPPVFDIIAVRPTTDVEI